MKSNIKVFVKKRILSPWHVFSLIAMLFHEAITSPPAFSRDGCFSSYLPCTIEVSGEGENVQAGVLLIPLGLSLSSSFKNPNSSEAQALGGYYTTLPSVLI